MAGPWIVEFNWKTRQLHYEYLKRRLENNLSELFERGKPANAYWVLIGICKDDELHEYMNAFIQRYDRESERRAKKKDAPSRPVQRGAQPRVGRLPKGTGVGRKQS